MTDCPPGWAGAPLYEICAINPRVDKNTIDIETVVSFVPMLAVEAETGKIDVSETRSFGAVRKGYTPFRKERHPIRQDHAVHGERQDGSRA